MSVKKMNNPQWKKFQPPAVQDPAILSFHQGPNMVSSFIPGAGGTRETGVIDKLQHSYGFIQCCDREARLFFHFSEFSGNAEDMKTGDYVQFQMSHDRRTGKPVATSVTKTDNFPLSEVLSSDRSVGTIVQEAKAAKGKNGTVSSSQDVLGRVSYEHNGECFFLPYSLEDLLDTSAKLKTGDQVTFLIATDRRNGNICARKLDLVTAPGKPAKRIQGVVCSMKESFGFIERADVVKEIFFHYSEYKGNFADLPLGGDVEFAIQNRNGKEVAVDITSLPEGTVIFDDVSLDVIRGKVLRTLKSGNNKRNSEVLRGRIMYETPEGSHEIPWGDKDQKGDYTLCVGDVVDFNIATDRRDNFQRATNIQLVEDSFDKQGEKRETGVVVSLKDGYGFIQCAERDARMFFHFSEFLDVNYEPALQDELEFTVAQDPSTMTKQIAIRIKFLPKGSVSFLTIYPEKYIGTIDREPATHKSQTKIKDTDNGNIIFDYKSEIRHISYTIKDIMDVKNPPRYGDKVEFSIGEHKRNNQKEAVNVRVVLRNITGKGQGFIATLKDNYGFIENAEHDKEVFFHFSSYDGDPGDLELGDEVEYTLARKSTKLSAENIRKLPKGSVAPEEIQWDKGVLQGKIVRPMRIVNPDQDDYSGIVQVGEEDDQDAPTYPYGITSLSDKRDFVQQGDIVKFQLAVTKSNGRYRAVNLAALRKLVRAKVDSVKGQFGFINYEVESGKKLFFHMTEVHGSTEIQPGDEVEFVVVQNQRNGKFSACSLRKISDSQRPDRLSRLKSLVDTGPRLTVVRQPKGPDNTGGFSQPRKLWKPPA